MTNYLTAKKLGMLPEERKALIAFVEAPALGKLVQVNGKAHYYTQGSSDDSVLAEENECGTAGCVAGYVFAHAKSVQRIKRLRGANSPSAYLAVAVGDDLDGDNNLVDAPLLERLYREGNDYKLADARRVVTRLLRTGKVVWPR